MNTVMVVIQVFSFIFVAMEIRVLRKTLELMHKDSDQQRKLASVENIGAIYRECRYALESRFGTKLLVESDIDAIENDKEYEASIVQLLSVLEHISVGINNDIYDKDVIFKMSAGSMISLYHRLELYIKHRQKNYNSKSYIEFIEIVREFEHRKAIELRDEYKYTNPLKNQSFSGDQW